MKNKKERITSPKGCAHFPHLIKPDTKFDPIGVYRTGLILDMQNEEHMEFIQLLDKMVDENVEITKAKLKKSGKAGKIKSIVRKSAYDEEYDNEGEPTGRFIVKFKNKAYIQFEDGNIKDLKPALFDSQGKPCSPEAIWGGSVLRINFTPFPYYVGATGLTGVSLKMNAIQIIELVQGGQGNASSFGFGKEDGFVAQQQPTFEANDDDVEDVGEDDF